MGRDVSGLLSARDHKYVSDFTNLILRRFLEHAFSDPRLGCLDAAKSVAALPLHGFHRVLHRDVDVRLPGKPV